MRTDAFIDGAFVPAAGGRTFATVSPRDGTEIAQVARGGAEDVGRAVSAARRAFDRGEWAHADPAQRGRVLVRLAELMTEHLDELARIEAIDKVYGEIAPTAADALALIGREPLGVEHLDGVMERVQRAADGGAGGARRTGGTRILTGGVRAEPVDQALALANDTRYGLAAALWTSDLRTAGRLARRLRAGTVWVNTFDASPMATPFGGFKDSGHGRDRSLHALEAYSQLKTTWISLA